jgi:aminopeptidase N
MASLTRQEAMKRSSDIEIQKMSVELDLRRPDSFTSKATIEFRYDSEDPTFVDFKGTKLESVELNGARVAPQWDDGRIAISPQRSDNRLVIEGVMAYGTAGEGLHQHIDPADGLRYLYAMSFLDAAPAWFGCFDQPDLKSRYEFNIVTPDDWIVVGNAPAAKDDDGIWHLGPTQPLSTYYVSIAAGPWEYLSESYEPRNMTLGILARKSLAAELHREADDIFEVTKQCLDEYHRHFDIPYQFGDYHQVFGPDFNAGAMENPGCVVFRDAYLLRGTPTRMQRANRAGVIAHEMAHQWFGDLVTMKWWDDLWLNESFAEYAGHRVCSEATKYDIWPEFGIQRKNWGSIADQGPNTHSIAGNGAADAQGSLANFDGISYAKGASVLRQLATRLGDSAFFAGLNNYFAAHRFGNATYADLIGAWQDASGQDLTDFTADWLMTSGMDLLRAVHDGDGWAIQATGPDGGPAVRSHSIECLALSDTGSRIDTGIVTDGFETQRSAEADRSSSTSVHTAIQWSGALDGRVTPGDLAFVLPDSSDATWARIRPSDWSRTPRISKIENATTRVVLHNAIRDAVRAGELKTADALKLVCEGMIGETEDVVVSDMLVFAAQLAGRWSNYEDRAEHRAAVFTTCQSLLDESLPGSDRQFICAKGAIAVCDDPEYLTAWLTGAGLPEGLRLDQATRWAIVKRLMVLNGDPGLIDAELKRDNSTDGHDHAAGARASINTIEAKQAALDIVLHDHDRRAYELYAVAERLFLPEQAQLCTPLVQPWFTGINATAEFRDGWSLAKVVEFSYPISCTSAATFDLSEAALAGMLDARVRRPMLEAHDMLRRCLLHIGE